MNKIRLQHLFDLYISGEASPEQQQEFEQLLLDPDNEAAIKQLLLNLVTDTHHNRPRSEASAATVLENIFAGSSQAAPPPPLPHLNNRSLYRWTAVAAILFMALAGGTWLWHALRPQPKAAPALVQLAPTKKTVQPGSTGAVLTLADGSQITLDSAGNGNLATQGNARLVKRNNVLAYEAATPGNVMLYNTLATARGQQFNLTLPDGTRIWMDAASRLYYPAVFAGSERKVSLEGQAYFEVAHDAAKPFIVTVGNMEVKVLGTHFNINAYADEQVAHTTLLEGKIKILNGKDSVILHPGQEAQTTKQHALQVLQQADTELAVAWKNGFTAFKSASLKTIMRQISRWYNVDIVYQGNIPERTFTGEIGRNADLSKLLQVLSASGIHFNIEGNQLTVMP